MSKFQGDIDWNAVANSGVKFAWIKATEGGDRADARFQANWEGAKAAGIPHGAYHFVYWCRPPLEEINYFEQNAPVEDDALPPVLDAEATPTSPTCRRHVAKDEAIADMQVMLQEMERHYRKWPIIYTTVDFYEANLSDGALMDYPIWVRSTKHHPAVKYGSRAWHFWQYQSDGRVPGIGGDVDKDAFYGTKEQWDAFLSKPGVRPCRPAPPSPRPTMHPRRRRLRSRRSLSPSPPAPSRNKAPPGGVGNLHRRPRFELQHPERVEGHCSTSYRARIRRSVFLVAAARIGGCPFPRAAFRGFPNGYVAGYARRRRTKGRELACQEPSWNENTKVFSGLAINSENISQRYSHY